MVNAKKHCVYYTPAGCARMHSGIMPLCIRASGAGNELKHMQKKGEKTWNKKI